MFALSMIFDSADRIEISGLPLVGLDLLAMQSSIGAMVFMPFLILLARVRD
jgi:hypothetical protein